MLLVSLAALAVIVIGYAISIYNKLIRLRNTSQSVWSDIDVQLKKRYDLVPNLVETVKGYATHERTLLEKLTAAPSTGMQASGPAETAHAENMFRDTLKSLFAVAEAYPDLKANQTSSNCRSSSKILRTASSRRAAITTLWFAISTRLSSSFRLI